MGKIIINYEDDVNPVIALDRVWGVIRGGRVSDNGSCYCFVTTWTDGVKVIADRTKAGTDTFRVERDA